MIRIRHTDEHDDEIAALDAACFPRDEGYQPSPPIDADGMEAWVALAGDDVVGFALLQRRDAGWYMMRVGVAPEWRARGIQRRLTAARMRWARRHGAGWVETWTDHYEWRSMRSLIRAGFLPVRPEYQYAGDDVVYWRRDL